jgi:hypothetical protein
MWWEALRKISAGNVGKRCKCRWIHGNVGYVSLNSIKTK